MPPKVFGPAHLIYVGIYLVVSIIALILIKKFCKTPRAKNTAIFYTALSLLAVIIWNRIEIAKVDGTWLELIPDTFCGMSSLLMAVCTLGFKDRNNPVFHCLIYLAIVGPVATLIYPAFIGEGPTIFYPETFSSLLHHSIMLFLAVLLLMTDEFVPDIKRWFCLPLGVCAYVAFGLFEIQVFNFPDAMQIETPLIAGTPTVWYTVLGIAVVVQMIIIGVYALLERTKTEGAAKSLR